MPHNQITSLELGQVQSHPPSSYILQLRNSQYHRPPSQSALRALKPRQVRPHRPWTRSSTHVTNKLSLEGVCDLYLNTDALWLKSCFGACSGRAAVEALHIAMARIDHLVGREHRGAGEEFDAAKRMFPDFDSGGGKLPFSVSHDLTVMLRPKT